MKLTNMVKKKQIQRFTVRSAGELRLLRLGVGLILARDYTPEQWPEQMAAIELGKKLNKARI